MAGRDRELDQGDEPPVRARPLLVRVDAETAVALLATEERAHDWPGKELLGVWRLLLAEDVAPRQVADRGLARPEQPVDGSLRLRFPGGDGHRPMFALTAAVRQLAA